MATWRRKLLGLFPELRVSASDSGFTPYEAFFELLPRCRNAHERNDEQELVSIYAYAEWCLNQQSQDLSNSAGVVFYEHLFEMPKIFWAETVQWLSPNVVASCRGLWESRLTPEDYQLLQYHINACKTKKYGILGDRTQAV